MKIFHQLARVDELGVCVRAGSDLAEKGFGGEDCEEVSKRSAGNRGKEEVSPRLPDALVHVAVACTWQRRTLTS